MMTDLQFGERDLDEDFIYVTSNALSRSLSSLSVARLQAAASASVVSAPDNLATSFALTNAAGLPQTVINTCLSLCDNKINFEERLCVLQEVMEAQDKLELLAQAGLLDAADVFCAAAFYNEDNTLDETWQALLPFIAEPQEALDRALALCAYHHELGNGAENYVDIDKVNTLIELGADVRAEGLWENVFDEGDDDMRIAFVRAGADAGRMLDRLDKERYSCVHLVEKLAGYTLYTRLDDQTLMQTTFLQPIDFKRRIDTIYRFDLAQVSEARADADVRSHRTSFAELPVQTLEAMREKLFGLGGNPLPLAATMRSGASLALFKSPQPKS